MSTETYLLQRFTQVYPQTGGAQLFSAPGRTELGGNHTDHQRGCILAGAVDLQARCAAAPNGTDEIRICSEGFDPVAFSLMDTAPLEAETGTLLSLARGIAAGVQEQGYPLQGTDLYITSQVPVGGGLSSSAAFEILLGRVFNRLYCGDALSPVELAQIGARAENRYFGKPCGLMDQLSSAYAGLIFVDFADPETPRVTPIPFDFSSFPYALCVIDTGSDHTGLTAEYAAIPEEMRRCAAFFGKEVLRQVDEAEFIQQLPALRKEVGDRAVLRAMHFFEENRRAQQEAAALLRGDGDAFLRLVRQSGESSWRLLQNVQRSGESRRQDMALTLALCEKLLEGRGACRVHGGGFAGMVQAYVPREKLDTFRRELEAVLGQGCLQELILLNG